MNGPEIAAGAMRFLIYPAQLVAVNVLWLVGTIAGGVIFGAFPATYAAGVVLDRLRRGDPSDHLVREFVSAYRSGFRRMALVGIPFWAVALITYVDLRILDTPQAGEIAWVAIPVLIVSAVAGLALLYVAPISVRYPRSPKETLRLVVLAPFAAWPITALVCLCVAAFVFIAVRTTVLIPLTGVSGPLLIAMLLIQPKLEQFDERAASSPPPS